MPDAFLHRTGIYKTHFPHFSWILEFIVKLHFEMKQGLEFIKAWGLFLSCSALFCPAPLFCCWSAINGLCIISDVAQRCLNVPVVREMWCVLPIGETSFCIDILLALFLKWTSWSYFIDAWEQILYFFIPTKSPAWLDEVLCTALGQVYINDVKDTSVFRECYILIKQGRWMAFANRRNTRLLKSTF